MDPLVGLDAIDCLDRIKFVTNYPRDFGDDILQVMAESPRICRYLHVPAQTGSDRMLKAMRRLYTRGEYDALVADIRAAIPTMAMSTDSGGSRRARRAVCSVGDQVLMGLRCAFAGGRSTGLALWQPGRD